VHVVASRQIYDEPDAALSCEVINGVAVHRGASTRFGRTGLLGRAFDYLSLYPDSA
jgi:colanic acid biosynthesis glycosyl transferase WcaI